MASPNSDNEVPKVSAATAIKYVQDMVDLETLTTRTQERAYERLSRDYGLTVSQLTHLYKAKAKTCDVGLYARVKAAYLDRCAKMAARMLHNIQLEEASGGDAHDQDLVDRLIAIRSEAMAKSAALRPRGEVR